MYFWERKNEIRDSDEKSAGCGILVKKERECGIRTPLPDSAVNVGGMRENMNIKPGKRDGGNWDALCFVSRQRDSIETYAGTWLASHVVVFRGGG